MANQVRLQPAQPSAILRELERKHDTATILNKTEATISCLLCLTRSDGTVRPGPKHKEMSRGTLVGHVEGKLHRRQLEQHNLPPDSVVGLIPGRMLQTWVMRCEACCLSPDGETREKYSAMDEATALAHFQAPDHERRRGDGRQERYAALHPDGESDQSEDEE